MTEHSEATKKMLESRKRLGPRLPRSPRAEHKPTFEHPRRPRATGAPTDAIK